MRLGLIGPADADPAALQMAAKLLISSLEVDWAIYLGVDAAINAFIAGQPSRSGDPIVGHRIADVAANGSTDDIRRVLRVLRGAQYLQRLRVVPRPPARSIEMIDDRIILVIHAKADIAEEDVINSNLVVYGDAKEQSFKRFGSRCFFSPGPLQLGRIGMLEEVPEEGGVLLKALSLDGTTLWSEPIQGRAAKVMVTP